MSGLALAAQQGFASTPGASTGFDYFPRSYTPGQRYTQVSGTPVSLCLCLGLCLCLCLRLCLCLV